MHGRRELEEGGRSAGLILGEVGSEDKLDWGTLDCHVSQSKVW